ncbi:MAG: hypothetical protein ISS71_05605 [Phycisphaerae bacterium]|nr:hypothetical protein [Phycisphaerae bacterium]
MADDNKKTTVTSPAPPKSFMTAGPTLHYSHANVLWCWALTILIFIVVCVFWQALLVNKPLLDLTGLLDTSQFQLGRYVVSPISIYEYPWQIVVLGTLMGVIATVPVLVSQLLSFRYSVPLILAIIIVAGLHLFGVFVWVSCLAVASRPLRFRSRFISVALCMAPQLVYWAIWGGYSTIDPVRSGFSFAPWIYAWLTGLVMAALVLGIGHFTRYKPGLIWIFSLVLLVVAFGVFHRHIGFAELDYQRNVANNNPEDAVQFHDNDVSATIDNIIKDDALRSFLVGKFYPTEPILLREKLKEEIRNLLAYDRWPEWDWFQKRMPEDLKYQAKRRQLINRYDVFMKRWPDSKRVAIALYFKAILNEYHPDVRYFGNTEILRFYSDYPFYDNLLIWQELYERFPQSPESFEARWRMAMREAAKAEFDKADELCAVALAMIRDYLNRPVQTQAKTADSDSIFTAFQEPARTVMTAFKLRDLENRLKRLQELINKENRGEDEVSKRRLANFVILNSHGLEYVPRLDELLKEMPQDDSLRDNLLLEKIMWAEDAKQRQQMLTAFIRQFTDTDAGIRAHYELALVKVQLWKEPLLPDQARQELLAETRTILTDFLNHYPESIFARKVRELLDTLPPKS